MILVFRILSFLLRAQGVALPEPLLLAGGEAFEGVKRLIFGLATDIMDRPQTKSCKTTTNFGVEEMLVPFLVSILVMAENKFTDPFQVVCQRSFDVLRNNMNESLPPGYMCSVCCAGTICVLISAFVMVRQNARDTGGTTLIVQATVGMHPSNQGVRGNNVEATIGEGGVWMFCRFEVFGREISATSDFKGL